MRRPGERGMNGPLLPPSRSQPTSIGENHELWAVSECHACQRRFLPTIRVVTRFVVSASHVLRIGTHA